MRLRARGWMRVMGPMLLLVTMASQAQVSTTPVADTIYRADGSLATGTVIVSWTAFTTAAGQTVPAGSTSAPIATGGAFSVQLAPNAGATPAGSFYTAVYHLDDGGVSREYWVVPVSQSPVTVSSIRSTVLPAAVAMQTVSKSYVDAQIAAVVTGQPTGVELPYVTKSGDAMSGPLTLASDPVSAAQAATKHYVDTSVGMLSSGLNQKVSIVPQTSQVIAQPSGTDVETNRLNGVEYASQYVNGFGNNGVANAAGTPDCANGCEVKVEQSYGSGEGYTPASWNFGPTSGTHVSDSRGGERHEIFFNPYSLTNPGTNTGEEIDVVSTRSTPSVVAQTHSPDPASIGVMINHSGLTGGSNLFPASIESAVPYFKTGYSALAVSGAYNTQGQHVLAPNTLDCFGVGDCLIGSQFIRASGGFRDEADEGAHPFDLQIREDSRVFQGQCAAGCTTGSTTLQVAVSANGGTQGEGRFLIDKSPAKVISGGQLTSGSYVGPGGSANFSGTAFPVSVFLATSGTIRSQASDVAPGAVTVAIATSGVDGGFATSTSALPSGSGVACVTDRPNAFLPVNYEMGVYTVIDATHLQMNLHKVHAAGATISVGGLCGYGIEQTVDTIDGVRQVFPVIGSISPTTLYYAGHLTTVLGISGATSAFLNVSKPIASISRSNNTVTLTMGGSLYVDVNGLSLTVAGVGDASFNGSFTVTSTSPSSVTYTQAGPDGASSGGTIGMVTGGYALYPMAEVLGVFNSSTKAVDGQLTLAPNAVAWAANDPVEEPHYFEEAVQADTEYVSQAVPRPTTYQRAGIQYEVNVGPNMRGWSIRNAAPVNSYFGNGGTHTPPDVAYEETGVWNRTMEAQAGEISVFQIHCNSHGCGRWNSGYNLFELQSATGEDFIDFQPASNALNVTMAGVGYGFSPQGFSAATINAGTVNATALNLGASLSAPSITAGSVSASSLSMSSDAANPPALTVLAPNLGPGVQVCQGFGKSVSPHASTFYCWWNTAIPYASLETYAGGDPLQMKGSSIWLNGGPVAIGSAATIGSALPALLNVGSNSQFQVDASGNVKAANFAGILSGTTGSIGGAALASGACASGAAAVGGATVGAPVAVSASDGSLPNGLSLLSAAVSAPGVVTVQVCAVAATMPPAKSYNVRVLQ